MSKAKKKSTPKATPTAAPKSKETPQELIALAQKQIHDTAEQINGLKVFCWHVDEGNGAYDFSIALFEVLKLIGEHTEDAIETLNQAVAQLQKGGAA